MYDYKRCSRKARLSMGSTPASPVDDEEHGPCDDEEGASGGAAVQEPQLAEAFGRWGVLSDVRPWPAACRDGHPRGACGPPD